MKNHLLRKELTIGIIVLFIGAGLLPLTATSSINDNDVSASVNNVTEPQLCTTTMDHPVYLANLTEMDIFRNGVDSTVFNYPNDHDVINGIGYTVGYYSNSLVLTNSIDELNIFQTSYKQDGTYLNQAHGIAVTPDQKYAYTVTYSSSSYLCMWDVTNIYVTPIRLNQTYLPSETGMYVELLGNYLILTTKSKIHIYDITNRNTTRQMNELSSFIYPGVNASTFYWHSLVVGNFLYVTSAYGSTAGGFVIFNITNKASPTPVRRVNDTINFIELREYYWHDFHYLISACKYVPASFYKGYIYVYNFSSGTLDNPTFLFRKCTNHNTDWFAAGAFSIKNGYLFCEQKNYNDSISSGIQVWNLTDLNNPLYSTEIMGNGPPNYLNLCHEVEFDQNGSDRTVYILTELDNDLVTVDPTWIINKNPIANFTYTTQGLSVIFNASSSSDPDGIITSWYWDFGDGVNGSGELITHHYLISGSYNVTLTVADDDGSNNSVMKRITVYEPKLQKAFIFGKLINLSSQGEFITFEAVKLRVITFDPFSFNTYLAGEEITIMKDYKGLVGTRYIFSFCDKVV
jgi:hypothetical protein